MPYLVRHGITGKRIGASGKARAAPFASLTIASIVAKNQSKAQGVTMQVWTTDANGAPEREIAWAYDEGLYDAAGHTIQAPGAGHLPATST
jgi:hypothetical protein